MTTSSLASSALQPRQVRDISTRLVRLRVVEMGQGPPLLLLHGFLMSHRAWDDVADKFAARFRVIVPDLPGFGESEKPPPGRFPYSIETFAECITDLLAALELGRTHIVGHAMSGAIAITLAAEHPEFVNKLVLVDPLVYPTIHQNKFISIPIIGALFFKQLYGKTLFRAHFRDNVFTPGFGVPTARIDYFYDLFNTPAARESALATLHALLDTRPTIARLTRIKAPTYVVWGRNDTLHPSHLGQRLAREIGAERLTFVTTGHAPHMEQPDVFFNHVNAFLQGAP